MKMLSLGKRIICAAKFLHEISVYHEISNFAWAKLDVSDQN